MISSSRKLPGQRCCAQGLDRVLADDDRARLGGARVAARARPSAAQPAIEPARGWPSSAPRPARPRAARAAAAAPDRAAPACGRGRGGSAPPRTSPRRLPSVMTMTLTCATPLAIFDLAVIAPALDQLEQAPLQRRRQADHLVEHQRAAVGLVDRAVDGALALVLRRRRRTARRATSSLGAPRRRHAHQRRALRMHQLVQRVRQPLFAGARLAADDRVGGVGRARAAASITSRMWRTDGCGDASRVSPSIELLKCPAVTSPSDDGSTSSWRHESLSYREKPSS